MALFHVEQRCLEALSRRVFHVEQCHVFHRSNLAFTFAPFRLSYLYLLITTIVGHTATCPVLGFSTIHAHFCTSPVSCSHRLPSILFH
jgi:hypothetical protein